MTLRPEFTAGVIRAYLENGMASRPKPVKLWSYGPIFRYERPQAGRYRQFTQFNIEAIGEMDPALDFEIMSVAWQLCSDLKFRDLGFQINSIGCPACRPGYIESLKAHFRSHEKELCGDCRSRLEKNPLRLLDCKKESCRPLADRAPRGADFLCKECGDHFETLKGHLDSMSMPYTVNPRLVRGLDYYTKTVFEVWAEGIGAQNAVCGGGRYDGLAEILGGPPTPGIGFAAGIERLVMTLMHQQIPVPDTARPDLYMACQDAKAMPEAVRLATLLRQAGASAVLGFGGRSLKAQLREADNRGARFAVIIGQEELGKQAVQVRDMAQAVQERVSWTDLITRFRRPRD
jgi:histidyl-tRNA synthetase